MEEKSLYEKMGGTYRKAGDYFIPNIEAPENDRPIGIWGCGCPVDTSAEGRSTDRAGRRDQGTSITYDVIIKCFSMNCNFLSSFTITSPT